jgi:DNA-binding NarL/FixJ family response regulator
VLGLLAQGYTNKAIASTLGISAKTVGNHVEHIYTKFGVTNRAGAALRAMELGIVGAAPVIA